MSEETKSFDELMTSNEELSAQVEGLTKELADAKETIATLTEARDTLQAECDALKAAAQTVEEAVAAKVAQLGLRDQPATPSQPKEEKLTVTQRCLQAKGLSLDDKVRLTVSGIN